MGTTFKKVKYTTLSPLHIGDGNTLGSLEYFVYNGRIYFYKSENLRRVFDSEQLEAFINFAISEESPDFLGFFKDFANKEQILKVISSRASSSLSFWGRETPPKIWTFIKSRNKPYIPGSEIKGAIRTAILRKLINDSSMNGYIVNGIRDLKKRFSGGNQNTRELRREFSRFEEKISGMALRVSGRNDAKFDFMKFVLVSDAESNKPEPFVARIEVKNASRGISDYHEIIPKGTEFESELGIASGKQFEEFAFRFHSDNQRNSFIGNLSPILKACYEMSAEIIEEELNFYHRIKLNTSVNQLEEIKKANNESSPVIRIGKHQGFMSITLAGFIKKLGDETYGNYVELLKIMGRRIDPNNFPKTRKVLANLAKEELTLGWIKIEVE